MYTGCIKHGKAVRGSWVENPHDLPITVLYDLLISHQFNHAQIMSLDTRYFSLFPLLVHIIRILIHTPNAPFSDTILDSKRPYFAEINNR